MSLIPFIDDNRLFQGMPDFYCTSQQFLDLGSGDYEEHAVLLCNYFNYIDGQQSKNVDVKNDGQIRSYLVMGKGIPEGLTTYVMRKHTKNSMVELWNAIKGEAYYFDP